MTASPLVPNMGTINVELLVNGSVSDSHYPLLEVHVEREINRIPFARILLLDGDIAEQRFAASESQDFIPGTRVEVRAGYGSRNTSIFVGIVISQGVQIEPNGRTALVLTASDAANVLTVARTTVIYREQTDSAIAESLLGDAGLSPDVEATGEVLEQIVCHDASPWDFLISRAEANGRVVLVEDGTVRVRRPTFAAPVLQLRAGESIEELDAEIDARGQLTKVTAAAWDPATQGAITADAAEPTTNAQGNLTGAALASAVSSTSERFIAQGTMSQGALKSWADGTLQRQRLARIRGSVRFPGSSLVLPGHTVTLGGMGTRVDGDAYVTRVEHRIEPGRWSTRVGFGLLPLSYAAQRRDIEPPGAAGLLPPARGLHVGTVNKIDADPLGHRRVRVTLPLLAETGEGIWARFAAPYASNDAGVVFLPEIGDEVVLGFLGDDPGSAVVLGALHSSSRVTPITADEPNTMKGIVTRSKLRLTFDDEKKILDMRTPGGHLITLDDDSKAITITDSNGSTISMTSDGISLSSPKDITLTAQGCVTIKGTTGITLTSSGGDLQGAGVNVGLDAKAAFTANGNASAKLTASGSVTVQGALVMIN